MKANDPMTHHRNPPSPYGYDFITCLTHDIDFMGIRDHKFDHTMQQRVPDGVLKIRMVNTQAGKGPSLILRVYRPESFSDGERGILHNSKDYPLNADKELGGGY